MPKMRNSLTDTGRQPQGSRRRIPIPNMNIHGVSAVIVRGAEDKLTPQDYAQRLAKKRNAELHVIPGASHLPNLEKPDALTDEIITFIEKAQTH